MADFNLPPADDAALETLLRAERSGPPAPGDATPWDFVRRWPDAVVRERVWPIVSRMLTDDDADLRERAVELVRDWSDGADVTVPRLLDVAEHQSAKFTGPLRDTLAHALSNRVDAATVRASRRCCGRSRRTSQSVAARRAYSEGTSRRSCRRRR